MGAIIAFAILPFLVKSSYTAFWTLLIEAGIGAGLFYFSLLFLNQQFADKKLLTNDFQIIKIGTLGRGNGNKSPQPFIIIDFYGTEKELVFYCDYANIIKHSTKVNLTYSKGALGFTVIKSKQLLQ